MTAALRSIRKSKPKKLVGAVAVASPSAARAMSREADAIVCLEVPAEFYAVGQFFKDFSQVSDEEVAAILQKREPTIGRELAWMLIPVRRKEGYLKYATRNFLRLEGGETRPLLLQTSGTGIR